MWNIKTNKRFSEMKKTYLLFFLTMCFSCFLYGEYNLKELNKKIESTITEVKNAENHSKRVEKYKALKKHISSLTTKDEKRYEYLVGLQLDLLNINIEWLNSPTEKKCKVTKHKLKEGYFPVHRTPKFPKHTQLLFKLVDALCSPLKVSQKKLSH